MTRILVVDDEDKLRELVGRILTEDLEVEVDEAEDGRQGLEKCSTKEYDVVISDITMPNMDGYEFFEQYKASGFQAPFIFYTGRGDDDGASRVLDQGAFDYLEKPVAPDALVALVEEAIRVSTNQKKLAEGFSEPSSTGELSIRKAAAVLPETSPEPEPEPSPEPSGNLNSVFAKEVLSQISAVRDAIGQLPTSENREWELGFLYRFSRLLNDGARSMNHAAIKTFTESLSETFTLLRVRPKLAHKESCFTLIEACDAIELVCRELESINGELPQPLKDVLNANSSKLRKIGH